MCSFHFHPSGRWIWTRRGGPSNDHISILGPWKGGVTSNSKSHHCQVIRWTLKLVPGNNLDHFPLGSIRKTNIMEFEYDWGFWTFTGDPHWHNFLLGTSQLGYLLHEWKPAASQDIKSKYIFWPRQRTNIANYIFVNLGTRSFRIQKLILKKGPKPSLIQRVVVCHLSQNSIHYS